MRKENMLNVGNRACLFPVRSSLQPAPAAMMARFREVAQVSIALLTLLKRMDRTEITPHGFRSTFRDWTAEQTEYPREVAEMALGHTVSNQVDAAYRRGDLFEKRRRLMEDWAMYCATRKRKIALIEHEAA